MRLKMKILLVHNYYQIGGGEDTVVEQERDLLSTKHEVQCLTKFANERITKTLREMIDKTLDLGIPQALKPQLYGTSKFMHPFTDV